MILQPPPQKKKKKQKTPPHPISMRNDAGINPNKHKTISTLKGEGEVCGKRHIPKQVDCPGSNGRNSSNLCYPGHGSFW